MKKIKCLFLLLILIFPLQIKALEKPILYSEKYLIYDLTEDKVLLEEKSQEKTNIASLTKIMTTITAIEKIKNLEEQVTITNKMLDGIVWDASVAGLKVGDKVSYRDLLYASMLPSGADATNILAYTLSGNPDNFVKEMNQKAKEIGMNSTNFINVTGLDTNNHYSTANDISKLLKYALTNNLFKTIYTSEEYILTNGLKVKSTLKKYNQLLNIDTSRILGSKTGYTGKAGLCLSYLIESSNHEFIVITLNANPDGKNKHLKDAQNIINYLDKNYKNQELIKEGTIIKKIPVKLSTISNYKISSPKTITKFLPNDYEKSKFKIKYQGLTELNFTNKKKSKIGTITYYYDKEKIYSTKVILEETIKVDFLKILKKYFLQATLIIVILLITIKIFINKVKNK